MSGCTLSPSSSLAMVTGDANIFSKLLLRLSRSRLAFSSETPFRSDVNSAASCFRICNEVNYCDLRREHHARAAATHDIARCYVADTCRVCRGSQ